MSLWLCSSDELQTASGVVSHLLIPNALVAVSEEQEGGDEKEKLDDHNHREDATFQVQNLNISLVHHCALHHSTSLTILFPFSPLARIALFYYDSCF